jgi:hypothetical protein
MKKFLALSLFLAGTSSAVLAQDWTVFVPPERDFKVLFPAPPTRLTERDGSIAFKAQTEENDYAVYYTVYRLAAGFRLAGDARTEIQRRLEARVNDDQQGVQYDSEQNEDPSWERYVFRHRPRGFSVHRLVQNRGTYYELEVATPRGPVGAIRTARDFFNSFQMTGAVVPPLAVTAGQTLDAWCQNRTDSFSLAFCKYSVCLHSGSEKYPHCTALPGR